KYIFNDRMIFSKGHAAPLLYSLYQAAGWIQHDELMTLRKFTSRLEGHPTNDLPWVDVATGSLGQGLSVGVGMALGMKLKIENLKLRIRREPMVYVLMGDSEFAEGQIYEALQVASHYKLNNLVGILDVNRLGQRGETMLGWDIETYKKRVESFGWNTIVIENGNDLEEVQKALTILQATSYQLPATGPTMIIARTEKGAGITSVANKDGWHGKPLTKEMLVEAIEELGEFDKEITGTVLKPEKIDAGDLRLVAKSENSTSNIQSLTSNFQLPTTPLATREAYGEAVKLMAEDPSVVILDAETSNSTYAEAMKQVAPERFFEMFIAEQNMVSVALGMSKVGLIPFASSFAAFLTRAYDQIRMSGLSLPNVKIVGSHAGVSIGEDGASQMALEDIAMIRALLHSIVLYPSDPVSTIKLVEEMRTHTGLSYLRLTRAKTETLYPTDEKFEIGGSKLLRHSEKDMAVIVAAGITVHEALKAATELEKKNIKVAIIDAYSVQPIDAKTIREFAEKSGRVIVVEDHGPNGGLGDAVRQALLTGHSDPPVGGEESINNLKFTHLAVRKTPRSGTPAELLRFEEIDAQAIVEAVTKE
ncbi:transketolase, partial [Candidatus Woesebacteria bacterium]|nr:transketolase [Candidatus Woesebacteria bacterium]